MFKIAQATGWENVISIDTDGLLSISPISLDSPGDGLGEWKTQVYDEAIVWQSGMYALRKDGVWDKAKTRGIARAAYSPDDLIRAVREGTRVLKLKQNKFLGYGLALNGQFDRNNTWVQEPYEFVMGGNGSRYHNERHCKKVCMGDIHRVGLKPILTALDPDPESEPHFLPWLDNKEEMMNRLSTIDDLMLFDRWDEEDWMPDVA